MTVVDVQDAREARLRAARVLRALKSYREVTDSELAAGIGASRSKVQAYMAGTSQLTIGLMYDFGKFLDVDPAVFLMDPDDALKWAIENRPNTGYDREARALRSRSFAEATPALVGPLLISA